MTARLEVRTLSKAFGGVQAVRDVSFDVHEGEILGVIGPNGSGKSTLFNCILGQLSPTPARSRSTAATSRGCGRRELNRLGVSRTFQLLQVFPQLTARENLILAGQEHRGSRLGAPVRSSRRRPRRRGRPHARVLPPRRARARDRGQPLLRPAEAARRRDGLHVGLAPGAARRAGGRRQPDHAGRACATGWRRSTARRAPPSW